MAALGLALFGLFCFVKVWQNVSVDQQVRRNEELRKELSVLQRENILLVAEIEELTRIERIQAKAVKEFGFVTAPKIKIPLSN